MLENKLKLSGFAVIIELWFLFKSCLNFSLMRFVVMIELWWNRCCLFHLCMYVKLLKIVSIRFIEFLLKLIENKLKLIGFVIMIELCSLLFLLKISICIEFLARFDWICSYDCIVIKSNILVIFLVVLDLKCWWT